MRRASTDFFCSQSVVSEACADPRAVSSTSVVEPYPSFNAQGGVSRAYLLGAMHDGTVRPRTLRISQREEAYVRFLRDLIIGLGRRAWTYRDGKSRHVYVVEFSRSLLNGVKLGPLRAWLDYARGYFDAEGGLPQFATGEPYLYFAQKNRKDLEALHDILCKIGITCGKIHNPSRRIDPAYWRFYVSRGSIPRFARYVGSWHPRKAPLLQGMAEAILKTHGIIETQGRSLARPSERTSQASGTPQGTLRAPCAIGLYGVPSARSPVFGSFSVSSGRWAGGPRHVRREIAASLRR